MMPRRLLLLLCLGLFGSFLVGQVSSTWMADNGNGTFTNPLFYEEFSDPDLIRVGDDFYLTGTTMHTMPGLPVLHSRDLVNWDFVAYACDRLDLGPEYRLEGGDIYGQGIWAPCFRYREGTYYIFTNVNGRTTQVFSAEDPKGPWTRRAMDCALHDLSVLFDDDGRILVVWGYDEIRLAELRPDLSGLVPGTEAVIIPAGQGMGEGAHFYKIDGRYYIVSANYAPVGRMVCARADQPEGPYETIVNSARETLGIDEGWRVSEMGRGPTLELIPPVPNGTSAIPLHQGGLVSTPAGEWWGFSMMDHNSIGRLTCLSPVTWVDGWPYFGLPGNLTRTPRTWVKPRTDRVETPRAPYQRDDDFSGPSLQPIWQWNHVPNDAHWSLSARAGALRLEAQPATDFLRARNTLTQRSIGPESQVTVRLDGAGMAPGDVAGLALLNVPYAWIGLARGPDGWSLEWFDQLSGDRLRESLEGPEVWLRGDFDFDHEVAQFGYSTDGAAFRPMGEAVVMAFQLKTFQGVRHALFAYNRERVAGGYADFLDFRVEELRPSAPGQAIPLERVITLTSRGDGTRLVAWNGLLRPVLADAPEASSAAGRFHVHDRGQGRVALSAEDGSGYVTVYGVGAPGDVRLAPEEAGDASLFQWQDMLRGDTMFLSLYNHRFLCAQSGVGEPVSADSPGARPDRRGGTVFRWEAVPSTTPASLP